MTVCIAVNGENVGKPSSDLGLLPTVPNIEFDSYPFLKNFFLCVECNFIIYDVLE